MHRAWNDEQFLVVAAQLFKGVPAEVAGMCLLSMDQQHRAADLVAVLQKRHIQERQRRGDIPTLVGVQRPRMIPAAGFVIVEVVFHKEGRILRQRVDHAARPGIGPALVVSRPLCIQGLAFFVARFLAVLCVKVASFTKRILYSGEVTTPDQNSVYD